MTTQLPQTLTIEIPAAYYANLLGGFLQLHIGGMDNVSDHYDELYGLMNDQLAKSLDDSYTVDNLYQFYTDSTFAFSPDGVIITFKRND